MIQALSKLIQSEFDWYVAIARGGLVPACLLSQITGVTKIDTFCASSYEDQTQQELILFLKDYGHLTDQRVLIIDDLVDSGLMMQTAVDYIRNIWQPKLIQTAVLFKKDCSTFDPDYFVTKCPADKWITFPWEDEQLLGECVGR